MKKARTEDIFAKYAPQYHARGFAPIPVERGGKRPLVRNWTAASRRSIEEIHDLGRKFPDANIGLLAGAILPNSRKFVAIDIDDPRIVEFVNTLAPAISGKIAQKGLTNFYQAEAEFKSTKLRGPGSSAPAIEIFATSGQLVVPPSIHPSGKPYRWVGHSLLDITADELTLLDASTIAILEAVLKNKNTWEIINGGPGVKGHDLMLRLTSCGIAHLTEDLDTLANALNSLFHSDYAGDTKTQTLAMLKSAREKGLGSAGRGAFKYDPGTEGPIPLGYTREGLYGFRDQVRSIIVLANANQLLSSQYLVGLAPSKFWASRFPHKKSVFNFWGAGEALLAACKHNGPFNPLKVRGRGIWREGDRIIVNFGGPIPPDVKNTYLCFEPIEFDKVETFDTKRLLNLLKQFHWRQPQDATLLLGWLALAPICGVLSWRPHCFVYGPPQSGKTTIHTLATRLLHPLGISADGQSSEAGVRQTLGPDSLPILLDEFESAVDF